MQPRLSNGRYASLNCPDCGYGILQPEGSGWRCNGLVDPERADGDLEPCERGIVGGVLFAHGGEVVAPKHPRQPC